MKELSNIKGTVGNTLKAHLNEINAEFNSSKSLVGLVESIFNEEISSNPYTVEVINNLKKKPREKQISYIYDIIMKGDGAGVI